MRYRCSSCGRKGHNKLSCKRAKKRKSNATRRAKKAKKKGVNHVCKAVSCPYCKAKKGKHCKTKSGDLMPGWHEARRKAYHAKKGTRHTVRRRKRRRI